MRICDRCKDRQTVVRLKNILDASEYDLCDECAPGFYKYVTGSDLEAVDNAIEVFGGHGGSPDFQRRRGRPPKT